MKRKFNMPIRYLVLMAFLGLHHYTSFGQCDPIKPTNVTAVDLGGGFIQVEWDIDCAGRTVLDCPEVGPSGLSYQVAAYGHSSPAPNGTLQEYSTTTFYATGCDFFKYVDGGMSNGVCADPKRSTCNDIEVFRRNVPGTTGGLFSAEVICNNDMFGVGAGRAMTQLSLCDGMSYDIYVWEVEIDQVPADNSFALPGLSPAEQVACGTWNFLDESPVSDVATVSIGGTLVQMSAPILQVVTVNTVYDDGTTSATGICATTASYSSTHQTTPSTTNAPGCAVTTADVQNDGISSQSNGVLGGDLVGASTLASDTSFTTAASRGTNTVLVNCREQVLADLPTPLGCKGTTDLTVFGLPLCNAAITTSTNAVVYFEANGNLINPNSTITYPTCFTEGVGTQACTPVTDATYPNNYTALFGNFVTADNCMTNVSGNPFANGLNPFLLPGAFTGIPTGATDAVSRQQSNICVTFEDDCNGTKATSCVKFLSSTAAMSATGRACAVTCAAGTGTVSDGSIIIQNLQGGSPDADRAGFDGTGYVFDFVSGPLSGVQTLTATGTPGEWEITGLDAGVYTIKIRDPLANPESAATCGSACPIELILEVLAPPIQNLTPTVTAPAACITTIDATVRGYNEVFASNGQANFAGGTSTPGDNTTNGVSTIATTGLFAGCSNQNITAATIAEVCVTNIDRTGGTTENVGGSQLFLVGPGGASIEVAQGDAFSDPNANIPAGSEFSGCFTVAFDPAGFAGLAGQAANGNWSLEIRNGFTTGTLTFDSWSITFNDINCTITTNISDFAACGAASAGTAPADVPLGELEWTPSATNPGNVADLTFTNASKSDATFTDPSPDNTSVTYCYDVAGYLEGAKFAADGLTPTCTNNECCQVTTQVCFVTNALPDAPTTTNLSFCEDNQASIAPTGGTGVSTCTTFNYYDMATGGTLLGTGSTLAQPNPAAGSYTYYVSCVNTNGCESPRTPVTVQIDELPVVEAGPAETVCADNTTLAATAATVGTGAWSTASTATVTDPASPTSGVTGLPVGASTFTWTVTNGNCVVTDDVIITRDPDLPVADAGTDQTICENPGTATLTANNPAPGTGMWTTASAATITSPASASTAVSGMNAAGSPYTFTWTITGGVCTPETNDVIITVFEEPTVAAGADQIVCADNGTLAATAAAVGTGMWSTTSAAAITDPTSPTSAVTGLPIGASTFTWTITNGDCVVSEDAIITRNAPPTVFAGADVEICEGEIAQLAASLGGTATSGTWTGGLGTFSNVNNPAATYTPNAVEANTVINLTWTSNDPDGAGIGCDPAVDDMNVIFKPTPIAQLTCPASPTVSHCDGNIDFAQTDGNAASLPTSTGVFGGSAAAYITGNPNPGQVASLDPFNAPQNIPLTLTYTLTNNGCTSMTSCTFTVIDTRSAEAGCISN